MHHDHGASHNPPSTTIVVGSDGTPAADRIVTVAQSLARDCQARVIVVHIDKVSRRRCARWHAVNVRESSRQLKALLQVIDLKGASVPAELKIKSTSGHVEVSIAEIAADCYVDLVVLGRSQRRWPPFLFRSVDQRVSRLARCPVLVVPSRD